MKTVFTFYKNSQKGQDLVEYALMLAIVIGIGWGIYSQTGVADSIMCSEMRRALWRRQRNRE